MKKTSADQQEAQVVKQAINDDQALSAVAGDIDVAVKDGVITLDGEVSTEQQMDLVTNTAKALGVDDKVNNHIAVTHYKLGKDNPRADDDGFALPKYKGLTRI